MRFTHIDVNVIKPLKMSIETIFDQFSFFPPEMDYLDDHITSRKSNSNWEFITGQLLPSALCPGQLFPELSYYKDALSAPLWFCHHPM